MKSRKTWVIMGLVAAVTIMGGKDSRGYNVVQNGDFEVTNSVYANTNRFLGWSETANGEAIVHAGALRINGARSAELVPQTSGVMYQDVSGGPVGPFVFECKFATFAGSAAKQSVFGVELVHNVQNSYRLAVGMLATNSTTGRKWVQVYSNTTWVTVLSVDGNDLPLNLSTDGDGGGKFTAANDTRVINTLTIECDYGSNPGYVITLNGVKSPRLNCFSGTNKPVNKGVERVRFICSNSGFLKDYMVDDVSLWPLIGSVFVIR